MPKKMTMAAFKKIVERRHKLEMAMIMSRVTHAEAFREWKYHYVNRFYYNRQAPRGCKLLLTR